MNEIKQTDMETKVRQYAFSRAIYEATQGVLNDRRACFEGENAELIAVVATRAEDLKQLESAIRAQAIAEFLATGQKKLGGGVGIRENKRAQYDLAAARVWAEEKRPDLITLDAKAYEKVLKSDGRDPFMPGDIVLEPSATIPTDLSAWLDPD